MGRSTKGPWIQRARGILDVAGFSPRSVLDFGAGEGHFVSALRELGSAAEGIETSPAGRAAARQLHGVELRAEISGAQGDQFQLITLVHSLEHVPDPVRTLTEVSPSRRLMAWCSSKSRTRGASICGGRPDDVRF
jgi:2-polyprenyl-3-methyl-5-hydroxy-6-metoxy-1,4-benzoquinol methylase